jgi:hypothetical protein
MTYLIWFLGLAAEQWLTRFSWLGLAAALLVGLGITLFVRRKTRALTRQAEAEAEALAVASAQAGAGAQAQAGAQVGAGVQVGAEAHAGTGAQRDQAEAGAGAPHALERIEPDRVAGRREGGG